MSSNYFKFAKSKIRKGNVSHLKKKICVIMHLQSRNGDFTELKLKLTKLFMAFDK